jgi:hypothetical protein
VPHTARELLAWIVLGAVPVLDGPGRCAVRAVDSALCADGGRPDVRGVVAGAGAVAASRLGVWRGELRADLGCLAALQCDRTAWRHGTRLITACCSALGGGLAAVPRRAKGGAAPGAVPG